MSELQLNRNQARVIAALVEKAVTTPAYYPMTVNGLMAACNQKNGRNPTMKLSESDVGGALTDLSEMKMAERDDSAGRVPKWRHRFGHELLLPPPVLAVLVSLMLRGPQTIAELRANATVLRGPNDAAGVQAALERLADRAQPLVRELPRSPGQAATRWAHLLCGEPEIPPAMAAGRVAAAAVDSDAVAELTVRVARLERDIAELREALGMPTAVADDAAGDD